MWRFGDLKQDGAGLQVSDLKPDKVDVVNVVLWFAEVACKGDRQGFRTLASLACASLRCT